ncbi:hypothetical protein NBRC116589_03690 [Ruegeria sp. HU-ET01832]|uniref:hypothetical protein n=1 Tax=Ruegeria sp. HU-ET01832 TaxID=3135906 RepID=UPI003101F3BB
MLNNIGLPGLILIAFFLLLPVLVGWAANKKGRSFLLWTVISIFTSAIIGFLLFRIAEETRRLSSTEQVSD